MAEITAKSTKPAKTVITNRGVTPVNVSTVSTVESSVSQADTIATPQQVQSVPQEKAVQYASAGEELIAKVTGKAPPAQTPDWQKDMPKDFPDAQVEPVQQLLYQAGQDYSRESAVAMLQNQWKAFRDPANAGLAYSGYSYQIDPIWQLGARITGMGAGAEPGEAGFVPGTPLSEAQQYRYGLKSYADAATDFTRMSPETKADYWKQRGVDAATAAQVLSEQEGVSLAAAKRTVKRYMENPKAEEFRDVRGVLEGALSARYAPTPQQQSAMAALKYKGLLDEQGSIKPEAYASKNRVVIRALRALMPERSYQSRKWLTTAVVIGASPSTSEVLVKGADGREAWIKTTPEGVQEAIAAVEAREAYDQWVSSFTARQKAEGYSDKRIAEQIAEITSGKYQVLDFDTNEFVPTYREAVEQREDLYRVYPEAGTSPGKIPLPKAIETRKAQYDARQTTLQELRDRGLATEVGKLSPGEFGPEVPEDLKWNYDLIGALDAGIDRSRLESLFGVAAITDADRLRTALKGIEGYKTKDGYNIAKLVLDAEKNPELLRHAQIAFDSDEGRAMLAKYQEQIRPSDAWWYRTDTGEYKKISDKERQRIINERGEFYAEQRITRTTEGLGAALQRIMMSPTLSPEFKPIETPSVDYMNRIADFDFFDKGGTVKERMALTDAMRRAGFVPSVAGFRLLSDADKKKVVDEFEMGPTVSRLLEPVDEKVGEWLESVNEWRTKGTISKPFRGVAAGGATLLSMLYSLPASGLKMVTDTAEGYHKATLAEAAMLPIGMTEFLSVQLPKAIRTDPVSGIPYAVTVLAPHLLLRGGLRVADTTFKYARGAVKPYRVTAGALALEEPVPRTQLAGNMSPYDAVALVSDVEKAWGGAKNVPINVREILKSDPVAAAIFTGMTKGTDIAIKSPRGTIIGRVNPSQMGIENVLYSVSTSTEAIAKEMGKTGGRFAPEGVQWFSPNYSADILGWPQYLSREGYSPGGVMLRFSSKDVMPYPKDIWEKAVTPKNIEAVKAEYRRAGKEIPDRVTLMNDAVRNEILRRGSLPPGHPEALPPGLYPLFKWHWSREPSGRLAPTYELEWIAPRGTDIFGFKPTGRAYRLATGETALPEVATLTLDSPVGAVDKVTGQGVRVGQKLPVIVAATKAALAEGKGIPSVKDMMAIQLLYKPYVGLKNVFQPGRAVRPAAAAGEAFTTRKWYSRAVKLESPEVVAEVAATKNILNNIVKRRGQEPLSTPELARTLGAIVDKDGRIVRTRDPHLHPKYDYSDNWVTSRVGVMLEHPTKKGSYIVFSDTAEPYGVYNMIGGQVDPMGTPRVKGRPKGRVSLEEAAREQMLSEVGVDLQQIRPARIHEGKTTEHSLYGTYMFDAQPSSLNFKVIKDAMGRYEVRDAITLSPGDKVVVTPALYIELYKRGFDVRNLAVADSHLPTAGIKQYPKGTPEYEILRQAKKADMVYDPKTRTYKGAPAIPKEKVIFSVPEAQVIKWPNPPARYIARGEIATGMEGALPFRDIIGERVKTRYLAPIVSGLGARERLVTGTDEAVPTAVSELRLSPPLEPESVPISPEDLTVRAMIEPEPVPAVSDTTIRPVEGLREGIVTTEPEPTMQATEETTTPAPEEGITPTPEEGITPTPEEKPAPTPEEGITPTPEEGIIPVPEERIVTGEETVTGADKGKRILRPPTSMAGIGKRIKIPAGSITFAWGKVLRGSGANRRKVPVWRYIPPPWTQSKPKTLYAPPIGAKNIDSSNPYTTIQMIGDAGAPVPERISIDLGISDAFVTGGGQSISFGGSGEKTNVGERIPITTQGMSVNGDGINRPAMTDYKPPSSVSRPHIAKTKEPVRGDTSVSGINRPKIAEDTKAMVEGTYVEPEPVKPKPKDNLSDLTSFTEKDSEEILELSDKDLDDLFGTGERKKKPVNRVKMRKTRPIRGNDNMTTLRGLRK